MKSDLCPESVSSAMRVGISRWRRYIRSGAMARFPKYLAGEGFDDTDFPFAFSCRRLSVDMSNGSLDGQALIPKGGRWNVQRWETSGRGLARFDDGCDGHVYGSTQLTRATGSDGPSTTNLLQRLRRQIR